MAYGRMKDCERVDPFEVATRAHDELLALLVHRIKSPLSPVRAAAETLMKYPDLEQAQRDKLCSCIVANVADMADMLETGLRSLKADCEQWDVSTEAVELNDLFLFVKEWIESWQPEGNLMLAQPQFRHGGIDDSVWMNKKEVQYALQHIVDNAWKHGMKGRHVTISYVHSPGFMGISVTNIKDPSSQPIDDSIFDPTIATTQKARGHGFGLRYVRKAMEAMGGRVTASTLCDISPDVDDTTVMTLWLPVISERLATIVEIVKAERLPV